ncbi:MAG: HDIG domain-containing protein [Gemmatimonadaceae bacterium]|jgi:putative nucleotidyltransferase with HDIG domain|nr:HDIG domain-containing protein [Gemmatimonadaceae bacterium]
MVPSLSRASALALVHDWTASDSLRKHMLAVEAAMRAYAPRFGGDVEAWGLAGLLHDFDYERFPNAAQAADAEHPAEGVRYLRSIGMEEEICDAILGHAHYTGVPRTTDMARALFACDELCGLLTACALVKPSKAIADVDVPGVRRKLKDKAFARGVNREDITSGADALGVSLDEHIAFVLEALRGIAPALGLAGVGLDAGPGAAASDAAASTPLAGGA